MGNNRNNLYVFYVVLPLQFRAMEKELLPAIENRIYTIRGQQVMLDSDLSTIFNVQVKRINEQVARNLSRFPTDFAFQLSSHEWQQLKSQIATSTSTKGGEGQGAKSVYGTRNRNASNSFKK